MNIRRKLIWLMQRVYGLALLFFGLNKVFSFLPLPLHYGFAQEFLTIISDSGYIMPIIAVVQLSVGTMLLTNRYVALGLVVLFPISLNIFFFHVLHDRGALMPAAIFMVWNTVLIFSRIEKYRPLLVAR